MELAKSKFEKEREKILGELPQSIKDSFGTIGFCSSEHDENDIIPVLVMNPYDVPPKPVRDVYWFDFFSKAKRTKKLAKLAYLVYHYGHNDPDDCYSFIEQDEFISYDDGVKNGHDSVPAAVQTKIDAGTELSEEEEIRVRGIKELLEDVPKAAADRKRGHEFKERHEMLAPAAAPPAKRQKKT